MEMGWKKWEPETTRLKQEQARLPFKLQTIETGMLRSSQRQVVPRHRSCPSFFAKRTLSQTNVSIAHSPKMVVSFD